MANEDKKVNESPSESVNSKTTRDKGVASTALLCGKTREELIGELGLAKYFAIDLPEVSMYSDNRMLIIKHIEYALKIIHKIETYQCNKWKTEK